MILVKKKKSTFLSHALASFWVACSSFLFKDIMLTFKALIVSPLYSYLLSKLCSNGKNSKPFVWKMCNVINKSAKKKKNMRACIVLEIMVFCTGFSLTSMLVKPSQCDAWRDQGRHGSVVGVDLNVTVYNYSSISRYVLFCSLKMAEFTILKTPKFFFF